ncbi:MAG: NAD(P)-dependent glycerol-3-phosphate dehydrogenase [Desulfobulbaceae bacterium]|uniref:Glycerol-3-phosphate dehydrogenase [NAD(P)+] n=1 Tax=Candidatus Desulfatifera sulfidica TaxID=2841691 RepID=A0A8J6N6X4_9BACT|nr:NAD(P)-dependent glycerol-3-phosphate dehydrogenase [Candidatus Desulfatifera sulfidica]
MPQQIAVIGAGSWGTAIAGLLAGKGISTLLWGHRPEHVAALTRERENKRYLPGFIFPEKLRPIADLVDVCDCSVVCMVVPSHGYRQVFTDLLPHLQPGTTVISAVKGIENQSLMTMTQVMAQVMTEATAGSNQQSRQIELAVLSGPSFAKEVALNLPTAVTIGCRNSEKAVQLQQTFVTDTFRVYGSNDLIGLEISAALKNIVAIAAGICDGLGFGLNSRAALITRGLAEMTRLGVKMGADPQTFFGLSGLGDLVLTCTGDLSRNRTVGLKLGQGKKLSQILEDMEMVAEGVKTTRSVHGLAAKLEVEMPILEQVYQILYEDKDCSTAVMDLLTRDLKQE